MEPYIGEITLFGGNFAPRGWAFCEGQLLVINQHQALFSLLGTIYGGDGRTTFALPDLRGRLAVHKGSGPGLSQVNLGQKGGTESETMTLETMLNHNHALPVSSEEGDSDDPDGMVLAVSPVNSYHNGSASGEYGLSTSLTGHSSASPIENRQPILAVRYIIALTGIYPSRS